MPEPAYFNSYQNFALTRDQHGVLLMRLHTAGGPLVFSGEAQRDLPLLLEEISLDFDNKAMVLTGTGDTFITDVDAATLGDVTNPGFYERYVRQQVIRGHQRLLKLPIPVIGVANGPATVTSNTCCCATSISRRIPRPTATPRIRRPAWWPVTGCTFSGKKSSGPLERSGCCGPGKRSTRRQRSNGESCPRSSPTTKPSTAACRSHAVSRPSHRAGSPCKKRLSTSISDAGSLTTFPPASRSKA